MNFPGHFLPTGGEFEYLLIGMILGVLLADWLIHDPKSRAALLRLIIFLLIAFGLISLIFWR